MKTFRANVEFSQAPINQDRADFTGALEQIAGDVAETRQLGAASLGFTCAGGRASSPTAMSTLLESRFSARNIRSTNICRSLGRPLIVIQSAISAILEIGYFRLTVLQFPIRRL